MQIGHVEHLFFDDFDGEPITEVQLGTYEVTSTTVTIHATARDTAGAPRRVTAMTVNYVLRMERED